MKRLRNELLGSTALSNHASGLARMFPPTFSVEVLIDSLSFEDGGFVTLEQIRAMRELARGASRH